MSEPSVSIIILNFNGANYLRDCLNSIFQTKYSNYDVIVVDNNSADESVAIIQNEFPKVDLIVNKKNLGYSRGNNIGILHSSGDFIVLLNNDTTVQPDWLQELVKQAKINQNQLYQPKILCAGGHKISSAGNFIQLFGFAFPRGMNEDDINQYDKLREISYPSGACVLFSKKLVKNLGLLDEGFYTFYEDVNWGWRASMLGFKSIYVPTATIYHKWGTSWGNKMNRRKFFYIEQSRLMTISRNYSSRTLFALLPFFLMVELCVIIYSLANGFGSEKALSYSDIFKNRSIIFRQRRDLQMKRKYSDSVVIRTFSVGISHPYLGGLSNVVNRLMLSLSAIAIKLVK